VGGGDAYNIEVGPPDLRNGGRRIIEEEDRATGVRAIVPEGESEDALGALPQEEDAAARFIREMEARQRDQDADQERKAA